MGRARSGGVRRNRVLTVAAVIVVLAALAVLAWQLGGEDEPRSADTTTTTAITSRTECPPVEGTSERRSDFDGPPEMCIDPAKAYSATLETTLGSFTIDLDPSRAPETVNNLVVLSRYHYYDGVPFHRVIPGFVIQAGDGDGTPDGSNDLGYTIPDELPDTPEDYVDYSVAMANSGPDTNGSQFFVVLPGGGAQLVQPAYSLFGRVIDGTDVVDAIGATGSADGTPSEEVLIDSVTIEEATAPS